MIPQALASAVKPETRVVVVWLLGASMLTSLVLLGLGWLSFAAYSALEASLGATGAMAAVGGGILLIAVSIALFLQIRDARARRRRERAEAAQAVSALVPKLLDTTQGAARAHPLGVLVTCAVAGFVAAAKPDIARAVISTLARGIDPHDERHG